jgi:pantothenate kinase
MECLVTGCNFLIRHIPNEIFTIDHETLELESKSIKNENVFPYLLVNIGSGVSIILVESETKYQRVGGSTIGGATLWGLGSLLTDANGFDELMEFAEKGDHREVDMLIKDIYGGSYDLLGLSNEIIASSLVKTTRSQMDNDASVKCSREEHLKKFKQEDLVKSILLMICYDVTQIASLHARLHNLKRVYFGGYFIRNNRLTMKHLKHGILFWSQVNESAIYIQIK